MMIALVFRGEEEGREGRNDKGKKRLPASSPKISFPVTPKGGLILRSGYVKSIWLTTEVTYRQAVGVSCLR